MRPSPISKSRRTTIANGDSGADMELDDEEEEEVEDRDVVEAGGDEEEEEEPEVQVDAVSPPPSPSPLPQSPPSPPKPVSKFAASTSKGKARARTPTPPLADLEDDIAAGLADVDDAPLESDKEPEAPPPKSKDKGKGKEKEKPPKRSRGDEEGDVARTPPSKKPRAKGKAKEAGPKSTVVAVGGKRKKRDFGNMFLTIPRIISYLIWYCIAAATPPNVRRSQRERFSPLEWWRNEKFVYGRSPDPDEGPLLVPLIKAIERPPKPLPVPLSKKNRGKRTRVKVKKEEEDEGGSGWIDGDGIFGAPRAVEEGMDEETEELGVVLDHATGNEIERRESFVSCLLGVFSFSQN
jgi:hypothetical protein